MVFLVVCSFLFAQEAQSKEPARSSVRERVIARYDTNGDGRLDAEEREKLRKSGGDRTRRESRRERQDVGPALTKQFDKDKDGKLSDAEYRAAERGLRAKWDELVRKFGAYKNDRLVVENLNKMEAAARKGEIKDFPPALYGWIYFVRSRDKRGGRKEEPHVLSQFDKNKDGKLDAAELVTARKAIAASRSARSKSGSHR